MLCVQNVGGKALLISLNLIVAEFMLASSPRSLIKLIMQPDTLLTTLRGLLFIVANSTVLMRPICCVSFGFRLFVNVSLWEPLNKRITSALFDF